MIDHTDAIEFLQKEYKDPIKRTITNVCPPTADRIVDYDSSVLGSTTPAYVKIAADKARLKMPSATVDECAVDDEDSSLLASLTMVFGGQRAGRTCAITAAGSGRTFLKLMITRAATADAADRAVVMASYIKLIQKGIEGEITAEKLSDFHEAYDLAEAHIQTALRQPEEAKVDMITRIALTDVAIRPLYLILEHPADEFKDNGSILATSPFKRLIAAADLAANRTFAYCRLGSPYQKYTTVHYTPEAGSVLASGASSTSRQASQRPCPLPSS